MEQPALAEIRILRRLVRRQIHPEGVGDLDEERAATPRPLRAGPRCRRQQETIACPRDGDVRQPPVLLELASPPGRDEVVERRLELLLRAGASPREPRQPRCISAERVRQHAEPQPALRALGGGGEFAVDETDDGDGIPLQTLRPVDREQLHHIVFRRLGAGRELVELLGMVEPREQARERAAVVRRQERVHLVDERAELGGRDPGRPPRLVRGQLDVQTQFPFDEPDQLRDRQTRRLAESREHPGCFSQPVLRRSGEPREPSVIVGVAEDEVERVDQRSLFVTRGGPDSRGHRFVERLQGGVVARDATGELRQRTEVGQADGPARPREEADERRAGPGIGDDPQRRHDIDHLRRRQESAQAEDPMRDAARAQRFPESHHVLLVAEQHGARRRPPRTRPLRSHPREPARHAIRLRVQVRFDCQLDGAGRGVRSWPQLPDRDRRGYGERSEHRIRRLQDALGVPPARQKGVLPALARIRERTGEPAQVARARAAPAVDRLVRVADRHHARVTEELREQVALHDGRVLVFVEEHDPVPVPQLSCNARMPAHDVERPRDLVGEVQHTQPPLLGVVLSCELDEERECLDLVRGLRDVCVHRRPRRGRGQFTHRPEGCRKRGECVEVDLVVHAVARNPQRGVDDRAHRLGSLLETGIVRREDDATHQEPGGGLGQQGGFGVTSDADRVLADHRVGEAVVGRHDRALQECVSRVGSRHRADARGEGVQRRMAHPLRRRSPLALQLGEDVEGALPVEAREGVEEASPLELGETTEAAIDALGELPRRLAGEGEPEDLVPVHDPVCDEPDDTSRHRLGLAAAGSCHHQGRRQRSRDDGGLLGGRGELAERGGDRLRAEQDAPRRCRRAHDALTAPIVWMRQSP